MSNKRSMVTTGCRIICMIFLLAMYFRNEKIELFLTSMVIIFLGFWFIPYCLTGLIMIIFKIKDDFGGVLLYDDTDPTNCKFRMIFNFDPEDLAKESTFVIKTERANLLARDENKD